MIEMTGIVSRYITIIIREVCYDYLGMDPVRNKVTFPVSFIYIKIKITCLESDRPDSLYQFERAGQLVATGKVVAVRCLMRRGHKPLPVKIPAGVAARLEQHRLPASAFSASSA